jgi:hypothetical protein
MDVTEVSFLEVDDDWITMLNRNLQVKKLHVKAINIPMKQVHNEFSERKRSR